MISKSRGLPFNGRTCKGIGRVVERIETSQGDIKGSVDALAQRIEELANEDKFVAALAEMQKEYLSRLSSSHEQLGQLLERQSGELRDVALRLSAKIEQEGEKNREKTGQEADRVIEVLGGEISKIQMPAGNVVPQQLPAPPPDFIGREDELNELRALMKSGSVTLSSLHGMGGVGKTALALKLADEFKDDYPDGQIYLDLKGVGRRSESGLRQQPLTSVEVMSHVIHAWHPEEKLPDGKAELEARYRTVLADKRALLLFDNARNAVQLTPLIPGNRRCLLLVTSRQRFALGGREPCDIDKLKPEDAVKLLRGNYSRLSEKEAKKIAEICDYLPMALKPAVSLLGNSRRLTPGELIKKLEDKKQLLSLKDAERKDEMLDISIEASFQLSYELLAEHEVGDLPQRWRTLAVFPDTFDEAAAAALWALGEDAAREALDALDCYSLIAITKAADTEALRYSLHDLARDFADTRLSATEREQVGLLHATYYLQLLSTANELFLKGGEAIAGGLSLFDNERVNIEAGQEWAAARFADDGQAAHLCNGYPGAGVYVLNLRQHPRDFIHWHEAALSAARQIKDHAAEGSHLGNLGYAYDDLGEYRRAIEFYEQQLAITREIGNRRGEGNALGNLGLAYAALGETRRAIEFYEQRLDIAREIGDRRGEGNALGNLGIAYKNLGETRRAIEFYEQQLVITREIGDRRGEGAALANLGNAYAALGETEKAIESMEAAVKIFEEIESPYANSVRGRLEELRGKSG